MKNVAIISARMGSTRLPGKVLKKLYKGKSVLQILIERLKLSKEVDHIVVGCTTDIRDQDIVRLCQVHEVDYYDKGDPTEALTTVVRTAKYVEDKMQEKINIVDITADCPFVDPQQIDCMLFEFNHKKYDYLSNCMIRSFPRGFDIQIYSSNLLFEIDVLVKNKKHRQHSGWNIWTYSALLQRIFGSYKYGNVVANETCFFPDWRIVLDYREDFDLLKYIIYTFNCIDFKYHEVIKLLNENPNVLNYNRNCMQKIAGK